MKGIHILVFILILNSLIPVFAGEPTHYAIRLSTAPGSTTSQSVSLLWGEGGKTDDDHHYSIYCNGKLLDTTAMTYYDVKNLHSDSSYHFQVKLQNKKNKVIYNSNLLYVRTSHQNISILKISVQLEMENHLTQKLFSRLLTPVTNKALLWFPKEYISREHFSLKVI